MYKSTHEFLRHQADCLHPKHYQVGDLVLTDDEKRDSILLAIKKLQEKIQAVPSGTHNPQRKEWGEKIKQLQIELQKTHVIYPPDFGHFFMHVAKGMVTKAHYRLIVKKAEWLFKAAEETRRVAGKKKDGLVIIDADGEDILSPFDRKKLLADRQIQEKYNQEQFQQAKEKFEVRKKEQFSGVAG